MSGDVVTIPTWRVTSASLKGSSHADNAPNQDAVWYATVTDALGGDVWVAAVSDGHGGKRYVRSDVGSSLAVGITVTHLADIVHQDRAPTPYDELLRREVPAIVGSWRESVLRHVGANPFTDAERARAGARLEGDPYLSYGATLLMAIVGEAGVGLAQIGDGDALIRAHGFATRPVPDDPRLVAGETTSLCLDSAVADFRYAALPESADPDLVLLTSDGYGNSFADKDWWRAVVGDLAWFLVDHDFEQFAQQFPGWLAESALVGGDDVSAVVVARSPLVVSPADVSGAVLAPLQRSHPNPAAPSVQQEETEERPWPPLGDEVAEPVLLPVVPRTLVDSPAETPTTHGPRAETAFDPASPHAKQSSNRAVWLAVLAVLVVLLAAGIATWLVTDGFWGSDEPSTPTPSQTPPPSSTPPNDGTGSGDRHAPKGGGHDKPQKPGDGQPGGADSPSTVQPGTSGSGTGAVGDD